MHTRQRLPSNEPSRRSQTRSCAECRRRRIRCDGNAAPCRQCSWYEVPHLCHYPLRRTRCTPSLSAFRELSISHDILHNVIATLFPSTPIQELQGLTRDRLLDLLQMPRANGMSALDDSPQSSMYCLEPPPGRDFTWDEVSDEEVPTRRVADDVNGLTLLIDDSKSSYLGISSIPAILRVMTHVSPQIRTSISKRSLRPEVLRQPSDSPTSVNMDTGTADELQLIDAYFSHIHAITPMVDESDFRRRYALHAGATEKNNQGPWLALLNMVLAMGYVASSMADQDGHAIYYKRAAEHLNFRCLGTGHILTVQALAILGGYYLHYIHKPNMANAILGATVRIAVAIGLHRKPTFQSEDIAQQRTREEMNMIHTRARTWASLFCLDTWGSATLGRPSFWCESVTTAVCLPPNNFLEPEPQDLMMNSSLHASESFCKIANRIQDRLVQPPLITPVEIETFDAELLRWQSSLPAFFIKIEDCPPSFRAARFVLRLRFLTLRLTMYRPYLLIRALRLSSQQQDADERETSLVNTCRSIAKDMIDSISLDWFPNQISAWHSSWYLFQACLVTLLGVISEPDSCERQGWDDSIQQTVDMLQEMTVWAPGAAQSRELICFIYEAQGTKGSPAAGNSDLFSFDGSFWNFFDAQLGGDTELDQSLFFGMDTFGSAGWTLPWL